MFWAAPVGTDHLTRVELESDGNAIPVMVWDGQSATEGVALDPIDWDSTYGIITSQTCDVGPTGPGQRHPTVQVSPCERYDHRDENTIKAIERREVVDLYPVPGLGPGKWAANLRLSAPVSKSILAQQTPVHGFDNEEGVLDFAEHVAAKYRRPALHDELIDGTTARLQELVRVARKQHKPWVDEIEQFRLTIVDGTRLNPGTVCLLAVCFNKLDESARKDLKEWRTAEDKRLRKVPGMSMAMAPIRFMTLGKIDVREYRDAVWLRIPALGQSVHF